MDSLRVFAGGQLDVSAYLLHHGVEVFRELDAGDGGRKWQLAECLFNPEHKNGDAAILQMANGALAYKCFHDSCQQYRWAEARAAIGLVLPEHWIGETSRTNGNPQPSYRRPGNQYTPKAAYDLQTVSTDDLLADTEELEFRVEGVLVHGQPCLIGGASKTLKTSIATDLAISVASGTPFLGAFPTAPTPALFVSAESGKIVLRHTVERVCNERQLAPKGLPLFWSFRRPNLADTGHLDALRREVDRHKVGVVILDPAYLLILAGAEAVSNLFAVGKILGKIVDTLEGTDTTLVLLHHFKKGVSTSRKGGEIADLTDFSYAAFAEWSRQWILLTRNGAYSPGSGLHSLTMSAGGSAGHSGAWQVLVDEGRPKDPLKGRTWAVSVRDLAEEVSDPVGDALRIIEAHSEPWSARWLRGELGQGANKTETLLQEMLDVGLIRIHSMVNGTARYVHTPLLEADSLL